MLSLRPKGYYKNHVKEWIVEMAAEIKIIDKNHLLEIGLKGFWGESMLDKKRNNPGYEVRTDFISNITT
ncbi:glycoside hydrolase, family 5 [Artemisia annua]|uniref:Glycoside hydrolase, family 5 n=1 Tax=Artemisia annua TaxID=35608 RepID=A0A2U1MXY1_ARTAN|nr:glycoside hydrolase, family 5 [Artemisia annua]